MDLWHPYAIRCEPDPYTDGGDMVTGVPWRLVIHTVEAGPEYLPDHRSYFGNPYWPHATIARVAGVARIVQHLPLNRAARALENRAGGVETNHLRAAQCEVAWYADRIHELPDDLGWALAVWLRWCSTQTGAPLSGPPFYGTDAGWSLSDVNARQRFTFADWQGFSGVCGHQHVPENVHWDPGGLDLAHVLDLAGPATPGTAPTPQPPNPQESTVTDRSLIPSWAKRAPNSPRWPFFRLLCTSTQAPHECMVFGYPGVPLAAGLDKFPGWSYGSFYGVPFVKLTGLSARPLDLAEAPDGTIDVIAEDGGTFTVATRV